MNADRYYRYNSPPINFVDTRYFVLVSTSEDHTHNTYQLVYNSPILSSV